jgi:F-type H+-transporting ATPase subunit gamma
MKEYNDKLQSLKNTSKMTKTMKMVSASKLRRAQESQKRAVDYDRRLKELVGRLAASVDASTHPLLQKRAEQKNVLLLVYTSDRGLCGGFNNNLIRMVTNWVGENRNLYDTITLSFLGKRGYGHFRNRETVGTHYEGVTASPAMHEAVDIGEALAREFLEGTYDAIYLAHNIFNSPLSQTPHMHPLLPFTSTAFLEGGDPIPHDYIFEPTQQELLNRLLPRILYFEIYFALLENAAGEHGARMTAMDSATSNAMDMIDRYTLLRNRARQAAITTELIEIVAGAEAL